MYSVNVLSGCAEAKMGGWKSINHAAGAEHKWERELNDSVCMPLKKGTRKEGESSSKVHDMSLLKLVYAYYKNE